MATVDVIRQFVGGGIIAANKPIAAKFGLTAAVLLHELAYWCERSEDGWCYRTRDELQDATTLSHEAQATARKVLIGAGVLTERREGLPARMYYYIDFDALAAVIESEGRQQETGITATGSRKDGDNTPESRLLTYKASKENKLEKQVDSAGGRDARFERFWLAYPRKVGKEPCRKAWEKIDPDDALTDAIIAAVEAQKDSRQWRKDNGEFIPHPTTWLNQKRWSDEVLPSVDDSSTMPVSNAIRSREAIERVRAKMNGHGTYIETTGGIIHEHA